MVEKIELVDEEVMDLTEELSDEALDRTEGPKYCCSSRREQ